MRKCRSLSICLSALACAFAATAAAADCPISLSLTDRASELPGRTSRKVRNFAGFKIIVKDARFTKAPESRSDGTTPGRTGRNGPAWSDHLPP